MNNEDIAGLGKWFKSVGEKPKKLILPAAAGVAIATIPEARLIVGKTISAVGKGIKASPKKLGINAANIRKAAIFTADSTLKALISKVNLDLNQQNFLRTSAINAGELSAQYAIESGINDPNKLMAITNNATTSYLNTEITKRLLASAPEATINKNILPIAGLGLVALMAIISIKKRGE